MGFYIIDELLRRGKRRRKETKDGFLSKRKNRSEPMCEVFATVWDLFTLGKSA